MHVYAFNWVAIKTFHGVAYRKCFHRDVLLYYVVGLNSIKNFFNVPLCHSRLWMNKR